MMSIDREHYDDTMTFVCSDCGYKTYIDFNSRAYFGKRDKFNMLITNMKKHAIKTGHKTGSVYHKEEKFLEVNATDGVKFTS